MSLVRAFNQPRNIRHHETLSLIVTDHAKIGDQGCKRVVGNFRPHCGNNRDQCRLTGVRHADNSNIGQEPQFDLQLAIFTGFTRLSKPWATVCRGNEVRIAFAASPAGGEHKTVASLNQIADSLAGPGVASNRSHWHSNDEVLAATPMAIAAHSVLAATGFALFVIAKIQQGRELWICNRDDIAT